MVKEVNKTWQMYKSRLFEEVRDKMIAKYQEKLCALENSATNQREKTHE